jgi:hypothetical protein
VAFSRKGWSEAREVSWSSHDGGFTVGLGRGALEEWFADPDNLQRPAGDVAAAHREVVAEGSAGDRFFELYADLNGLRHALEPLGDEDRMTPVLAALHLANARDVMLHGTWIARAAAPEGDVAPDSGGPGALLAFDATWSARSERPGVIHRLRATAGTWPQPFVLPRPPSPPARYAIVADLEPGAVVRQGIDLYAGSLSSARQREFARARARWEREHGAEMRRVIQSLESRIMLSDHPRPVVAVPGATTVFMPLKAGVERARFERDVQDVLSGFGDLVVWDEQERAWSVYLEENRIVRVATWGVAEVGETTEEAAEQRRRKPRLVLVGGFDLTLGEGTPSALLRANRGWIGQMPRD